MCIYNGPEQSGQRPRVMFSIISHAQVPVLSQWSEASLLAVWERGLLQAPPRYCVYSYSQSQLSRGESLPYTSAGTMQTYCKKGRFLINQFFIKYSFSSSLLYFSYGFSWVIRAIYKIHWLTLCLDGSNTPPSNINSLSLLLLCYYWDTNYTLPNIFNLLCPLCYHFPLLWAGSPRNTDLVLWFWLLKCQKLYGWNDTSLPQSSFAMWLSRHVFAFLVSVPSQVLFSFPLLWLFFCLPLNQLSDIINDAARPAGFMHHLKLLLSSNFLPRSCTCQNTVCIKIYHIWIE